MSTGSLFDVLPEDLQNFVYRKYFNANVLPEIEARRKLADDSLELASCRVLHVDSKISSVEAMETRPHTHGTDGSCFLCGISCISKAECEDSHTYHCALGNFMGEDDIEAIYICDFVCLDYLNDFMDAEDAEVILVKFHNTSRAFIIEQFCRMND